MSAEFLELIPHTDVAAAREQFGRLGHVGLTGLYDPAQGESAIEQAKSLFLKSKRRALGEYVGKLRLTAMPDENRYGALHAVLSGVQTGAELLGRDISPSSPGEKPRIELLDMEPGTKGPLHRDGPVLADVVAVTNLRGRSHLWMEGDGDGATYTIDPGDVVIHDLARQLLHRGYTGPDETRVGLAIAKARD